MKATGALIASLLIGGVVEPTDALLGRLFGGRKKKTAAANKPASNPAVAPVRPSESVDNEGAGYIFNGNEKWKNERLQQDPQYFDKLGNTDTPDHMYIGCVDACVPPDMLSEDKPGNVFVHRNVANLVVSTDVNLLAALQYAVGSLKIKDIIICGHYNCGGVRAAESSVDHGAPLEQWLRNVRDVYRLHKDELDAIDDPEARHRRLVELNVIEQCVNIFKTGIVQRSRLNAYRAGEEMTPRVHATVFDSETGDLKRIPFDFSEYSEALSDIYGLYAMEK